LSAGFPQPSVLRFGVFELDLATGELRKSGRRLKLPPQPFKVLALIASHPGELVTREEIQRQLWGSETFVDFEQGMNHCIKQIRNALGDNAETPRYVETVPRRGYRFIAPVEEVRTGPPGAGREGEPVQEAVGPHSEASARVALRSTVELAPPSGHVQRRLVIAGGVAALVLVVAAAVAGAFWLARGRKSSPSAQDQPSIAVLPFEDISPEKNQDYFSDGLAAELLDALAKIPGLRVTARTSSFQFKGKTEDSVVIGKKLHVANLLEGSVRKQGNRVKIATQLIKTKDGFQVWSHTYDRDLTDIFAVQEDIARAVTGALKVTLLGAKAAVPSAKSTNTEAHNAYLQGRYFLHGGRNKESLEKAVGYFEQAIKLDHDYAPAWVGLGETCTSQAGLGYIPVKEGYRKAREAVERALVLDADLGEAYSALGWIRMFYDWDWAGADASFQRALALEPGNARMIGRAGLLALFMGRLDDATALCRRAMEIDPLNFVVTQNAGIALYYAGRHEEAKAAFQKILELDPEMANTHCLLGRIYLTESHSQEALAEMEKEKHHSSHLWGLALTYYALGRKKESDANLAELIAKFQAVDPYQIAAVYAFRGETDSAFKWLERAYTARDSGLDEIKTDPLLERLRPDPRYAALLKKMRLV
jgi:TolB-like protein/DNA-binding winged helix-turn-helix (wHTH) protein/cytochrome c-type biogenesis protein CcmH/NrfG